MIASAEAAASWKVAAVTDPEAPSCTFFTASSVCQWTRERDRASKGEDDFRRDAVLPLNEDLSLTQEPAGNRAVQGGVCRGAPQSSLCRPHKASPCLRLTSSVSLRSREQQGRLLWLGEGAGLLGCGSLPWRPRGFWRPAPRPLLRGSDGVPACQREAMGNVTRGGGHAFALRGREEGNATREGSGQPLCCMSQEYCLEFLVPLFWASPAPDIAGASHNGDLHG